MCTHREHHPHDRAEKAICENVWFYLWKINSAYNLIIIPFLETLTPINVVKIWEATKCLPPPQTSYMNKHLLLRPTKISPLSPWSVDFKYRKVRGDLTSCHGEKSTLIAV